VVIDRSRQQGTYNIDWNAVYDDVDWSPNMMKNDRDLPMHFGVAAAACDGVTCHHFFVHVLPHLAVAVWGFLSGQDNASRKRFDLAGNVQDTQRTHERACHTKMRFGHPESGWCMSRSLGKKCPTSATGTTGRLQIGWQALASLAGVRHLLPLLLHSDPTCLRISSSWNHTAGSK
jgi:hypothetical protein